VKSISTANGNLALFEAWLYFSENGIDAVLISSGLLTLINKPDFDADQMNAVDEFPNQ